jgi:Holliday junction resolvasome RuvABC ATP-dependent DNA helicase subunit
MLTKTLLYKMLRLHQIDPIVGLDYASRNYITKMLRESRPLGSRSIANMCQEQESTVISMIEPFLLSDITLEYINPSNGQTVVIISPFVRITSKGRIALEAAYKYIKLCQSLQKQGWFNNEALSVKPE